MVRNSKSLLYCPLKSSPVFSEGTQNQWCIKRKKKKIGAHFLLWDWNKILQNYESPYNRVCYYYWPVITQSPQVSFISLLLTLMSLSQLDGHTLTAPGLRSHFKSGLQFMLSLYGPWLLMTFSNHLSSYLRSRKASLLQYMKATHSISIYLSLQAGHTTAFISSTSPRVSVSAHELLSCYMDSHLSLSDRCLFNVHCPTAKPKTWTSGFTFH